MSFPKTQKPPLTFLVNVPCDNPDDRAWQSLGMAYLAADLLNNGLPVQIIDGCGVHKDMSYGEIYEEIRSARPDYVGFYIVEPNLGSTLRLINELKATCRFTAFLGGPLASLSGYDLISHHENVDFIMCGESDGKLPRLIAGLFTDAGIIYRDGSKIIVNDMSCENCDLDSLPFPIRELNGVNLLTKTRNDEEGLYILPVSSSRGCPAKCTFCIVPALHKHHNVSWRFRSAKSIVREVSESYEKHKNINVAFIDDNFFVDVQRAVEIGAGIRSLGDIPFSFSSRVDAILKVEVGILRDLRAFGLRAIEIGVENFNDNVLKRYRKGHTREDAILAIRKLRECNIASGIDFIMFDPWTTIDELSRNLDVIEKESLDIRLNPIIYSRVLPYVGAEIANSIDMKKYFYNERVGQIYNSLMSFREAYQSRLSSIAVKNENALQTLLCLKTPCLYLMELLQEPTLPFHKSNSYKRLVNVVNIDQKRNG